ncbi:hypothetical protein [Streptomyces sp. H34-S4]|uniref:hypothetical protein n=1 Tax=Streptomyces sp. H34-S4 TaxID=2996463 RepID=UPI00227077C5|nr:hypothetical protein [Streptomyces sp. H34-S4]MCY0933143.1 hypothetical protein [Streptomyces sp. H34-S4]
MSGPVRSRVRSWAAANVSEFRVGVALVVLGLPLTAVGGLLYALSRPGFREVAIGLSVLTTGLMMAASQVGRERGQAKAK